MVTVTVRTRSLTRHTRRAASRMAAAARRPHSIPPRTRVLAGSSGSPGPRAAATSAARTRCTARTRATRRAVAITYSKAAARPAVSRLGRTTLQAIGSPSTPRRLGRTRALATARRNSGWLEYDGVRGVWAREGARGLVKRTKIDCTRTIKVAYDYPLIRSRHRVLSRPRRSSFPTRSRRLRPRRHRPRRRPHRLCCFLRRRRRRRCPRPAPAQGRLLCIYAKRRALHLLGPSPAVVCLYFIRPRVLLPACMFLYSLWPYPLVLIPPSPHHRHIAPTRPSITRIISSISPPSHLIPDATDDRNAVPVPLNPPPSLPCIPCTRSRPAASCTHICTSTSLSSPSHPHPLVVASA